jgi:hypothetical protein
VRLRALAALWILIGIVIWNAFFDLYIARGAQQYLQAKAEYDLGLGPSVEMDVMMARTRRHGVLMSTLWASVVVGAGWATIWIARRRVVPADHTSPGT